MNLPALIQQDQSASGRGVLRAARLMRALGPAASAVWSELSPEEADQLSVAMNSPACSTVDSAPGAVDTDAFVEDYRSQPAALPHRAASVWSQVGTLDPASIAKSFERENPQVIAVVLSRLEPEAAARTVRALPRETATAALHRLLHLGRIRKEAMDVIELALTDLVRAGLGHSSADGHEAVARIFDQLGANHERGLLAALDQTEPGAAERIRSLMFTFDDLANLGTPAIQTILASVDRSDLAVALKGAGSGVRNAILSNMTKRAGDLLVSEIEGIGPLRRSDIEAARQSITALARSLAKRGDILAQSDIEDELVE